LVKRVLKLSFTVFDVTDPSNPSEIDKYTLDEYWSEAVNNHHAFLLDRNMRFSSCQAVRAVIYFPIAVIN